MSQKTEKKIRRLYTRDFKHRMDEVIGDIYKQLGQLVKPAPRYVPNWLWKRLAGIFLNLD